MKFFGKELKFNNNKVYHAGDKPTPNEIGAATSSHTHNYAGSSSAGGNANAAVKLATARTINGTSFNGSANITTANWGAARTLTIGSTGKSVNGSANVAWTLAEIGAFPVAGGTINGNVYAKGDAVIDGDLTAYYGTTTLDSLYVHNVANFEDDVCIKDGQSMYIGQDEVYHPGNKPTASEIGAAAASHGYHVPTVCDTVTDWNSATRNGWFMGYGAANSPLTNKWYMGYVIAHNSNYLIQEIFEFTTGAANIYNVPRYSRVKYNGSWGEWKQHFVNGGNPGDYWGKNVAIGGDGVVEVGKYMDWHYTNNSTTDYDVRWQMTDAGTIESTGTFGAPAMKIGGHRVHVSSGTPSSPPVGTVWIQI